MKPLPASDTAFFIRGTPARFSFLRDARLGRVTGMESRDVTFAACVDASSFAGLAFDLGGSVGPTGC